MKRSDKGRGIFHTRDSGGEHETTPSEYVRWARGRAKELGVSFAPTPEQIEAMIRDGRSQDGDLFLDYGVKGNRLQRPGLDALFAAVETDPTITHVFIPMRQRLARPDDPLDAMKIEDRLREAGLTLVFMDLTLAPIKAGKRDIGERIVAMIDYDRAGNERRDLATKMIYAQLALAKAGFSTGGRPPFGFRRWLVNAAGVPVRQLAEGEYVKRAGHHVVWLPGPEAELALIRRILHMLETMPAARVAAILTAEGIPTPDAGRLRTDRGVKHRTSGVWHEQTINNIARNLLLLAVMEHGRRSMGDKLRFTPDGPRELTDSDNRADGKPKVVINPPSTRIRATTAFSPLVDPDRHQRLLEDLDRRGGTQRGKPRSHTPDKNPLGGRVIDANCAWPMYRQPYGDSFRYLCGLYQQSHGERCDHNHVDGPTAVRFGLSTLRQCLVSQGVLARLRIRVRQMADSKSRPNPVGNELANKRSSLATLNSALATAGKNMTYAETLEQYKFMSAAFDEALAAVRKIEAEIVEIENRITKPQSIAAEIEAAMSVLERLPELANDPENLADAGKAFGLVNLRMFVRFKPVQSGKRVLNKLACGAFAFGTAPAPFKLYDGPTDRRQIKLESAAMVAARSGTPANDAGGPESFVSGDEGNSLGNVNRGERI